MEIRGESLDDVLNDLYTDLPAEGRHIAGTRGDIVEILAVVLRIRNPRARLSRSENRGKLFSALGELLWYLSGRNDVAFIREYISAYDDEADTDGTVFGAYGPRLFAMRGNIDQILSISALLKSNRNSKRAVIQLFNAEDIVSTQKEVPCTTTMHFVIREDKLYLSVTLRSNDAYKGLPHDVFCFTMLQEMVARTLGVDVGEYYQFVGSMHVYTKDMKNIKRYLEEGYHKIAEMPAMPDGNPFQQIPALLECESRCRRGEYFDASVMVPDPYWRDLVCLLQADWARGMGSRLDELSLRLHYPGFRTYLETRRNLPMREFENESPEAQK